MSAIVNDNQVISKELDYKMQSFSHPQYQFFGGKRRNTGNCRSGRKRSERAL